MNRVFDGKHRVVEQQPGDSYLSLVYEVRGAELAAPGEVWP